MTVYTRHLLSRDHSALRAYPFWDDAFILGRSHLADFDIETPLLVYDRCSRWTRVVDTLGSVFSAYLVGFGYPLSFVTHLSILHWTLLYLRPSYQSLTSFEPTYFIVLHDLIHFSCDQRRMQTSLGLSGWVFTCLWTLGSTSLMMVGPIRFVDAFVMIFSCW